MKFIADFHIHSKYSRATSPRMDLENLDEMAKIKGVNVMGVGDFTHPLWFSDLSTKLESVEPGLFKLRGSQTGTRFILTSEISCIYSKNGKVRKIHLLIMAPDIKTVQKINNKLNTIGNLKADGRPILGLDAKELTKIVLDASPDCMVTGAHIWTPWFSLFGSKSGFDTIEECFEEYSKYIYAVETGLSSDPEMNWRLSALDKITLISNSDAHSPEKIGREANVFNTELNYSAIMAAIKSKDPTKFLYTIEFFPQEGRYHFDGHRACDNCTNPEQTKKNNGLCSVCGKPTTVGTLSRVEELADRTVGQKPKNAIPYKSLMPLREIIAEVLGVGPSTKKVAEQYNKIVPVLGSELDVLLNVEINDIGGVSASEIGEAVLSVRQGKVYIEPGYDGVYGKVSIFNKKKRPNVAKQDSLF